MEGFIYICLSIHPSFLPFIFLLPPVHPPLALPGPAVPRPRVRVPCRVSL